MAKDKQIARLLRADISSTNNLIEIAQMLQSKGRGKDTVLAHITPAEAKLLKSRGGRGSKNPDTGLLEFEGADVTEIAPVETPAPTTDMGGAQGLQMPSFQTNIQPSAAETAAGEYSPSGFQTSYTGPAGTSVSPSAFTSGANYAAPSVSAGPALTAVSPEGQTVAASQPAATTDQTDKPWYNKLSTTDLVRLGLAGTLGATGLMNQKKAAQQAQAQQAQEQAIAQPYQTTGQQLQAQAQSGNLTAAGQQSLQAFQAQQAQNVQNRGGVGAAQAAAAVESMRQQLLQNQYNYGIQVSQIGDQIALGAIQTGLQANQQLQTASQNFYTQLAAIGGGVAIGGTK